MNKHKRRRLHRQLSHLSDLHRALRRQRKVPQTPPVLPHPLPQLPRAHLIERAALEQLKRRRSSTQPSKLQRLELNIAVRRSGRRSRSRHKQQQLLIVESIQWSYPSALLDL